MGKRSGGRKLPFFSRSSSSSSSSKRKSSARRLPSLPKQDSAARALLASPSGASPSATPPAAAAGQTAQPPPPLSVAAGAGGAVSGKVGKKKAGGRLWMRLDRWGASELVELDKASIIRRAGLPPRDLRILGPVFSHSSSILAREKAMVINLEFIRAIVTAEEVLLLDPIRHEVLPFVDQLRQLLPLKSLVGRNGECAPAGNGEKQDGPPGGQVPCINEATGAEHELPFEFQVLEVALEIVCSLLDLSVADLERHATPVLDELTKNVSTRNLERVRSLKSDLTRLLARVQKVRDEIEHLLDDNEDMEHLYLTRKQVQNQQVEALMSSAASNSIVPAGTGVHRLSSSFRRSVSIATSMHLDNDVEDLEMLLEAYFMQLDGIRNRILSVREYIDDTEDYVNIQLNNQRNELIQLQLTLTIASFGIAANTYIAGAFAMNIPSSLYNITDGSLFWPFVGGTSSGCFIIFLLLLGYAWWKKLLGP
ncbi:putative magnesium transporter MRS2-G [Dichanthelium oligosanthes]|uniref:Magnesium transporter n=1 Tax=Dichanthelium oligosanthes TaxID=888268 RepID=A0A1E5VE61_9POAL|nr:putative magnesium transporter MRS2-G [Dichanthelium oligosanthes]